MTGTPTRMDDVDRLEERNEKLMEALIAYRKPVVTRTGTCLFCDETLAVGVFCDADCRSDYEKEQYMQSQRPR
jgi:hypothetical protein